MRRSLLGFVLGALVWVSAGARVHAQANDAAEIVLVGAADATAELQRVVDELLAREGIDAVFTRAERFMPEALLAAPDSDRRVRVFITLPTPDAPQLARLYMRGPFGRRFLLRDLTLRNGMDEVGRESIAHVAATSTQALLHSSAGIDRDAVRADLDRQGIVPAHSDNTAPSPSTTANPSNAPSARATRATSVRLEIGLRDTMRWTGSALRERWGIGAEIGLTQQADPSLLFRQRLVFEHSAAQSLDVPELLAFVRTTALRLGQDVAWVSGAHRGALGLAAGVDVLRVAPERARDASWSLGADYTEVVPMLRAELRYEIALPWAYAALSAYLDVALRSLRFEVRDGSQRRTVAEAPHLMPGLALSLGFRSF